ncbi:MAG: FAD-dependent oxidoreductase, partial [Nanoarchaeota archaeon]
LKDLVNKDFDVVDKIEIYKNSDKKHRFEIFSQGKKFNSKTIIFATGSKWKKLNVKGEKEYENRGVSYCALCDGALFKGKTVGVVGGSDSAVKEALLLTEYAKKVYIIYRGEKIHPEPINLDRAKKMIKKGKIEIINNTNVIEIKGDGEKINSVVFDKTYRGKKDFKLDGLFVDIGHIPLSDLAKDVGVKINDKSEIIIDRKSDTNIKGFYAAGDVTDTEFKQAITGVGEAVHAVYSVYEYVNNGEFILPVGDGE